MPLAIGPILRRTAILALAGLAAGCAQQRGAIYEASLTAGDYAVLNCAELSEAQFSIDQLLGVTEALDRRDLLAEARARIGATRAAKGCEGGAAPVATRPAEAMAPPRGATVAMDPIPDGLRYLQIGTFRVPENRARTVARMEGYGYDVEVRPLTVAGVTYERVIIGPFASRAEIAEADRRLEAMGLRDSFFVN